MKIHNTVFLVLMSIATFGQQPVAGFYRDNFGSSIKVNKDGTFKYMWRFDMSMSWTKGTWSQSNDTLYFNMFPVFDTVLLLTTQGTAFDTLILSEDEVSSRIPGPGTHEFYSPIRRHPSQNSQPFPDKLFYRHDRLYNIKNGRLLTKKLKGFWSNEKYDPWYFKTVDK
ncbi:MAG: hypothetical protein ACT4ON_06935 [Bacteroidota bacterium]